MHIRRRGTPPSLACPRLGHGPPRSTTAGIALALAAGSCYGGYSVAAGHLISRGAPPPAAMGSMFGLAATILLPVLALTGQTLLTTSQGILLAGYLAVLAVRAPPPGGAGNR